MRNLIQLVTLASLFFMGALSTSVPKRKIAYWSVFDGELTATPGDADFSQLDGLTHLILFAVDLRNEIEGVSVRDQPLHISESTRNLKGVEAAARAKGIKIMGAVGGWGQDQRFFTETDATQGSLAKAVKLGEEIADFALERNWDGIDIDHEYPNTTTTFWPDMIDAIKKKIKKKAPNMILSLAMPGKPYNAPNKDPLTHVMSGYTQAVMERIDPMVDFYNVMTYDMVNRYSNGTKAYHHSYLAGMVNSMADLEALGVKKSKMNMGFAYYAKWFPISTTPCTTPSGLDCTLDDPLLETNCGAFRHEIKHNVNYGYPELLWEKAIASHEKYVLADTATKPGKYYDKQQKADSVYDKESQLFWTWQSPHAISETCEALKKIDGLGGQFVFSLGQDREDLAHHKAWTTCVASWK